MLSSLGIMAIKIIENLVAGPRDDVLLGKKVEQSMACASNYLSSASLALHCFPPLSASLQELAEGQM
jgi:hypothetical protein